jgi:uncharacterized protein (TIGR00251 family)
VIRTTASGIEIDIRVIPRAKKTSIDGERDHAVLIRLAAPPVDGAANDALIRFLAQLCSVPRHAVRILSGEHGRKKRVAIDGVSATSMRELIRGSGVR